VRCEEQSTPEFSAWTCGHLTCCRATSRRGVCSRLRRVCHGRHWVRVEVASYLQLCAVFCRGRCSREKESHRILFPAPLESCLQLPSTTISAAVSRTSTRSRTECCKGVPSLVSKRPDIHFVRSGVCARPEYPQLPILLSQQKIRMAKTTKTVQQQTLNWRAVIAFF
jgi:hypothetical protein